MFFKVILALFVLAIIIGWGVGTYLGKHGNEKVSCNVPLINLNCGGCFNIIFHVVCFVIAGIGLYIIASAVFK